MLVAGSIHFDWYNTVYNDNVHQALLFEEHERGPSDDLALQLEAINQMPEGEQMVIREVLESLIIKYQSRRWDSGRQAAKR
ncbi:hypothetical protein [Vibrio brasiliensis]